MFVEWWQHLEGDRTFCLSHLSEPVRYFTASSARSRLSVGAQQCVTMFSQAVMQCYYCCGVKRQHRFLLEKASVPFFAPLLM